MTPKQIRNRVLKLVRRYDPELAAAFEPLFVGEKAGMEASWQGDLTRVLNYDSRCNECGKIARAGTQAVWIKDAGTWHILCYKGATKE